MTPSEREEIEKVARGISRGDTQIEWEIVEAIITQVEKARAEERERCAKIAESFTNRAFSVVSSEYANFHNAKIADRIRNKLEKE